MGVIHGQVGTDKEIRLFPPVLFQMTDQQGQLLIVLGAFGLRLITEKFTGIGHQPGQLLP